MSAAAAVGAAALAMPESEFGRRLREAGVTYGTEEVAQLIEGVAAAPPGFEAEAWMTLLAEDLPDPLKQELNRRLLAARARIEAGGSGDPHERLERLRRELKRHRLTGFVIPRADAHQGEYVPLAAERLRWLTGFSGSAGTAIVLAEAAALFVDGRYTVQAKEETRDGGFTLCHSVSQPMTAWIAEHLPPQGRLGYDPWLHTASQVRLLEEACDKAGGCAIAVAENPIDRLWHDRPPPPIAPVVIHPEVFAGVSQEEKRRQMAVVLAAADEEAAILAQPDSIAWLLNIRGGDVPFAPLPLAFAILRKDATVTMYCDHRKLTPRVIEYLGPGVTLAETSALAADLAALAGGGGRVRVDPDGTPQWIVHRLQHDGVSLSHGADPCLMPKAMKNPVEQEGIRAAHRRDGAALSRFLAWLSAHAETGELTEIAAAERLASLRSAGEHYRGPSFPTISAAAGNGAIVHYRATAASNRKLTAESLYLVDSGGQYLDGTTDVTRTVAIGMPTRLMRSRFTQVLKGHIALAQAVFPRGTTGSQLDVLARTALWRAGADYDHGTGHGVGAYLGVHEGPQRISKIPNRIPLEPGMIISNEPGYYRENEFGIRIENLVMVSPHAAPEDSGLELIGFETLTLAPIDRALIDVSALTAEELGWLNAYHARVGETLLPLVDPPTAAWLAMATAPLG